MKVLGTIIPILLWRQLVTIATIAKVNYTYIKSMLKV